jgi:hypothetical protein
LVFVHLPSGALAALQAVLCCFLEYGVVCCQQERLSFSAASNGRRLALLTGGSFLPPDPWKGGLLMITYSDLIQTGILVVGIIALFIQANKKK